MDNQTMPRWAAALLRRVTQPDRADDLIGDAEESHRRRVERRGPAIASVMTTIETLDLVAALLVSRVKRKDLSPSWLDIKLGFRMLAKYPGLTLVGTLAIAVAIALGTAYFEVTDKILDPTIPLEGGDRIVQLENWDATEFGYRRVSLQDLALWRDMLESVEEIGAYRTLERNLITEDGRSEPALDMAEISASAFRIARVPSLLGRTLVDEDERLGAPAVIVIGYEAWQTRFEGDADVVGREVRLGGVPHTVVGVMPKGFAFPVNHHYWVPFRLDTRYGETAPDPVIELFGRLAEGVTIRQAQAELTALAANSPVRQGDGDEPVRPQVIRYGTMVTAGGARILRLIQLVFLMVLAVACANVAALVFARTTTRQNEIAVRTALGASRGRIVMQLFAEALVLAAIATIVGLVVVRIGLEQGIRAFAQTFGERVAFWWTADIAPATIVYAALLAVLAAAIAGVAPALHATGPRVEARLRAAASGSGLGFGRLWTGVIIAQVAMSLALLPLAIGMGWGQIRARTTDLAFPAEEYQSALLAHDLEDSPGDSARARFLARYRATYEELERRLEQEPIVVSVTIADRFPGMDHPNRRIEVEDVAPPEIAAAAQASPPGHEVQTALVGADFFDAFGAPLLAGRAFNAGDLHSDGRVVIVNESFVRQVLAGRNAIGRRVRYASGAGGEPGPWYEIIGVVKNLGLDREMITAQGPPSGMYHPLAAEAGREGGAFPVRLAIHVRGAAASFGPRLRAVAAHLDPTLRLYDVLPLDGIVDQNNRFEHLMITATAWVLGILVTIGLLLSTAGTYALMSFIVARRTREIGIRAALGASPRRIIAAIFSRALLQVGIGAAIGAGFYVLLFTWSLLAQPPQGRHLGTDDVLLFLAVVAIMTLVAVIACGVPARRALRIQPTEALKE
jgi:predicted permease